MDALLPFHDQPDTPHQAELGIIHLDPPQARLQQARARLERQAAADYLKSTGLRIFGQDWTCRAGTADLIAGNRRILVVCRVKTRPAHARTGKLARFQIRRLRRIGLAWLAMNGVLYEELRIDFITLTRQDTGEFDIDHVPGVG